jgi:DNA replicative helicase MCM subunit Mcm2 (Cdc46/Mcm family)
MLNLNKNNNNFGFSGNNNKNSNNSYSNYNTNNSRSNTTMSTNSYSSDNAMLQVFNVIKEISRKKNGQVTREDILQQGEQKLRDRKKVDNCINNLLSEGFIMEEDDVFSVITNYTG